MTYNYINNFFKQALKNWIEVPINSSDIFEVAEVQISIKYKNKSNWDDEDKTFNQAVACIYEAMKAMSNLDELIWDFYNVELICKPSDSCSLESSSVIRARFFAKKKEEDKE